MASSDKDFTVEDIEYLRHGDRPLLMTLYRPAAGGPFPTVIDLHGGAWNNGDRSECAARAAVLAGRGLAVAALDFRHGPDGYPTSLADINYAVRWLKAKAGSLNLAAGAIGLCGQSSGGHLAMLSAMRPFDTRYATIPLPAGSPAVDATVGCVAMSWPVINPLSRYRNVLRLRSGANPPAWVGDLPERHDTYWRTEAAMAEGNPTMALERGEAVRTPPALWLQGKPDPVHDYHDPESPFAGNEPERFAAGYQRAGGQCEIAAIDQATRQSEATYQLIADFCLRHLTVGAKGRSAA